MFTVKCKYFADANFNKFLNIRKFFAIFLKKSSLSPPSFINFCYQGKGASLPVYQSTSQQVYKLKSDESDESDRSDKRWV